MKRTILESPYSGEVARNVRYARLCLLDCLRRNEAPLASHLLYTQVLHDASDAERAHGMRAGFSWLTQAELVVVYQDFGISGGMQQGIDLAQAAAIPVEYRTLPADLRTKL